MASFFEHIGSEVESAADESALASAQAAEAAKVAAEAARDSAASSAADASNSEATVTSSQNAAAASATASAASAATSTTKALESAASEATSATKASESAASAATATTKAIEASASATTAATKAAEATSARDDITGLTASTGAAGSSASYDSSTGVLTVPRGDTGATGSQGIQGPAGQDSTVAGPQGPAGQDSTVAGPQGPAGQDSTVAGPQGIQGVQGPQGVAGVDGTQFDTNVLKVDGTNNRVGVNDTTPSVSLDAGSNTDAIAVPVGTTAQRPADGAGRFRYNSTTQAFEGYTTEWGSIAGGGGTNTFTTDSFTANGSTTAYALSQVTSSKDSLLVFIDGVFQTQDAYSIATAGGATTLTFSAAPANNRKIIIYSVAAAVSGSNLNIDSMTGDGSDVTLTLSIAPVNENNTQVFIDGVYQSKSNYSISGTTLTFSTAPPTGTAVEVMTFTQTDINVPVDGTITPAKIASGDFYFDTDTLYVDATNNRVGIGVTTPTGNLEIATSASDAGVDLVLDGNKTSNGGIGSIIFNNNGDSVGMIRSNRASANDAADMLFYTQATGGANTERMRIDSLGNVGIGMPPASGHDLAVYDATNTSFSLHNSTTGTAATDGFRLQAIGSDAYVVNNEAGNLRFYTSATERMRIDAGGTLLVGRTSSLGGGQVTIQSNGSQGLAIGYGSGTNEYRRLYQHSTGLYFESSTNQAYLSAAGAWTNASDVTIKKDIEDIDYGIETVKSLKPRKYKMKSDDEVQIGFIAQELAEQVPEIVGGKEGLLGVSYGQLTAVLTKAIQEQQATIESQATAITDLTTRLTALENN